MNNEFDVRDEDRSRRLAEAVQKREILSTLLVVALKMQQLRGEPEFQAACEEVTAILRREMRFAEERIGRDGEG
jgi:hypothetical protein